MCGIAGIVGDSSAQTMVSAAQRMAAAMRHRGPDSCGVISSGECLLANTRLAILDLSERGRQPMANAARTIWISYNGETYNASGLRRDLIAEGYSFRSTTDTEVILHLYEKYGDGCVERMHGMFAFAVWDARAHKLLLGRDRLGIKPLYFARQNERLIFASELKCLLASGLVEPRLNPQALRIYLQLGHVPPPWTIIDGVVPLPPGYTATWQNDAWNMRPYWALEGCRSPSEASSAAAQSDRLGDVLIEAMQTHLISDVPIALFLSGGIDSACLAALARGAGAENFTALTIGFSEHEFDETALSARTARTLQLPFKAVVLSPERVAAEIDACIWALDEPSVDGVNSYWISTIAAEHGFKVAMSGQGGDELFGGYGSWKWFERFEAIGAWTRHLPLSWSRLLDHEQWPYRWRKLSYLFGDCDAFLASQMAVKILFLESDVERLLSPPLSERGACGDAREYLNTCASRFGQRDSREMLSLMDIRTHLQPRLLRDLDAMSMAHSVEVRPVFLDDRVVESVLSTPGPARARPKELLLQAMRRFMPSELVTDLKSRSKRTFTFPFANWLARDLKLPLVKAFSPESLRDGGILEPKTVGRLWERFQRSPETVGWSRIWNLFVLARWCEVMNVRP
jgi:asparagine synthase (glutamine-hydrolysing)